MSSRTESSLAPNPAATAGVSADHAGAGPDRLTLTKTRPFRVKLHGCVLVLIQRPNHTQVRAALQQLSTTGGLIHVEKPLDENLEVELAFHLNEATIRNKAKILFPMWATQGWMQPFRFIDLSDDNHIALAVALESYVIHAPSDERPRI